MLHTPLRRLRASTAVCLACTSLAAATPALAEEATPEWTVPVSLSFVSDYIFRGQTQTWGKPALQFSVEADHASGAYVGFFASNVADHWLPGAAVEMDFYGGYRGKIADTVGYDAGLIYYTYPGGNWTDSVFAGYNRSNSLNTLEAYLALSYEWLTFKTGRQLTEYFGWSTNNSPTNGGFFGDSSAGVTGSTRGSHFFELNAAYDVAEGWNVSGQIGRQYISHTTGLNISYYKVGVTRALPDGWSAGAFFSASSEPKAYDSYYSLSDGTSKHDIAKEKFFVSIAKAF
ncbi:TorF family putative porin [Zoogloea sp.]|uniref:TorF family putative porin n=1 Tax=Zoogloea sp. TaxID=49181 RepID=UPI001416E96C|nr:MAG: hypothetical protein F9K15_23655 [Zoogloea sp.]